jgi:hypothetical protein
LLSWRIDWTRDLRFALGKRRPNLTHQAKRSRSSGVFVQIKGRIVILLHISAEPATDQTPAPIVLPPTLHDEQQSFWADELQEMLDDYD